MPSARSTARRAATPKRRLRAEVLTPLAKAWGTDVGCEVASLGIQVHGGMGFIEETGAAQHLRDARIAPIYEGTNGIQAADLVGRKLGLDGGLAFDGLIADIRAEAAGPAADRADRRGRGRRGHLREAAPDDRLAGSYPFLTMCSVLVAGWLVERHGASRRRRAIHAARARRRTISSARSCRKRSGLAPAAEAGAALLYAVPAEALA